MTNPPDPSPPLANDPAREATNALRGYSYQLLRSVLAWLQLNDGEVLYLEGAEDFDVVEGKDAAVTQVKDTAGSGTVTLRTAGVLDAVRNFWAHRNRNPGRRISFRYLTTSSVGMEQGDPMSKGLPGLELWRSAQSESEPERMAYVASIKSFLVDQVRLPEDLREYLKTASDAEVLEKIIVPISWDTEAEPLLNVLQTIEDRLVELGLGKGIAARDAEAVLGALYTEASIVAIKDQGRSLTRAAALRLFDQQTRISVPKAQVAAFIGRQLGHAEASSPLDAIVGGEMVVMVPPPQPVRYYRRSSVLTAVAQAARNPISVLQGATGTGKTTLAAAHANSSAHPWGWIDLRGYEPEVIRLRLLEALAYVSATREGLPLILDDLNTSKNPHLYEGALARLAAEQSKKGVPLLITTAQDFSQRLCQLTNFDPDTTVRTVPFSREEIVAFLSERGCGSDRCATWAGLIELTTLGHPQLVHARVAALEAAGFPQPSPTDLLATPPEVLDARAEARRLLAQLDTPTRDLIYRLSLTIGNFDRERLLSIAGVPPPIHEPGNSIDALVGPWLEVVRPSRYRISPLVRSAGQEAMGDSWARDMHRKIGRLLLQQKTLTPDDVSEVLMHALIAEDSFALFRLSLGLLSASNEVWRAIGEAASWFVHVASEPGTKLPTEGAGASLMVRLMQFRIAAVVGDSAAKKIAERFDEEYARTEHDELARIIRLQFLTQVLLEGDIEYPIAALVGRAIEYVKLTESLDSELGSSVGIDHPTRGEKIVPSDLAGFALMPRIRVADDLATMLRQLRNEKPGLSSAVLGPIGADEWAANLLLNQTWLHEYRLPNPDWQRVVEALNEAYRFGREFKLGSMTRAAAEILVRVTDEELKDAVGAVELARKFVDEIGDSPGLKNARARVLARDGDDVEALKLWREALPNWNSSPEDMAPSPAYRDAALAAVRLGGWSEAARLLTDGSEQAVIPDQTAYSAGMLIDAGFAFWKAGENMDALRRFIAGIELLETLQDYADSEPVLSVQKRAGHTLMWVAAAMEGRPPGKFSEPPPACCSNLEGMVNEPPIQQTPIDFIIGHLLEFEHYSGLGSEVLERYSKRLMDSPYGLVRLVAADFAYRQTLRELNVNRLMSAVIDESENLRLANQFYREGGLGATMPLPEGAHPMIGPEYDELIRTLLFFGLLALVARGEPQSAPLKSWREEAENREVGGAIGDLLEIFEQLFVTAEIDPWEATKNPKGDWRNQDLAALCLSTLDETSPAQMIQGHGLLAHHLGRLPNRDKIAADLLRHIIQSWSRLAERAFLLHNPRHCLPPLQAALNSPVEGWAKIKNILLAASDCAGMPSNHPARVAIESVPDETPNAS